MPALMVALKLYDQLAPLRSTTRPADVSPQVGGDLGDTTAAAAPSGIPTSTHPHDYSHYQPQLPIHS